MFINIQAAKNRKARKYIFVDSNKIVRRLNNSMASFRVLIDERLEQQNLHQ